MNEIIKTLDERASFRQHVLNLFPKDKEVFCFYMMAQANIGVSNLGTIKNFDTGHVYTQFQNSDGYHTINLIHSKRGRKCMMVQRVVAETYFSYMGFDNYFYEVNHINGVKSDNSIYNLEWLTRRENLDHGVRTGLFKNGQLFPNVPKTEHLRIFELSDAGMSQAQIARQYNTKAKTINLILKKERNI